MKRVILLQILLLASFAAAATDPNLVGWWKFDDGAGTIASDSAGGNNGTLINGPTWATGKFEGGLRFDGVNDYVEVPYNDSLGPGCITLSAWAHPDTVSRSMMLVAKSRYSDCSSEQYALSISTGATPASSIKRNSSCAIGYGWKEVWASSSIAAGQWYLFTSTWDGSVFKIYLNGELSGTNSSIPAGLIDYCPGGTLRFGIWWSKAQVPFQGVMDDIRIYNRALSADEIQRLFSGELTGLEITGPNEVAEESTVPYKAIAQYDNGTTKDVTALAEWQVEPNTIAAIEAGQLTTERVLYPTQNIKIYARYTEELTTVDANLPVSVIAICPQGNALKFDGMNDYVQIPNGPNNQITTNQMSISAWIKLARNVGPTQRRIICKQEDNPRAWGLEIGGSGYAGLVGNQVVFHDSSGTTFANCISPMNLIPGNWYHLGVSDDAGKIRLYINGILSKAIDTGFGIPPHITAPIMIGRTNPDSTFYFDGIIDEVAVFNRALSADEIQAIMNVKLTGGESNLVAYWDFDEGMGQTANDISGHGNNGMLGSNAGIDTADPCWVASDIPVPCTTEQVTLRNIIGAIDNKKAANQLIDDAKARERASISLIDEITDIDKQDALKAKANIHVAIVQEDIVSRQIDATIQRLENALLLLDYVFDSNDESLPPIPLGLSFSKKPVKQSRPKF